MRMVLDPERRFPLALQVKLAFWDEPVLTLEVTETGFTFAGSDGTLSGLALGKLMADDPNCSFALAAMFVDKVTVWL